MTEQDGTLGQDATTATRVVTGQVLFAPQQFYPYSYPQYPQYGFPAQVAQQFTFEVLAEQPVRTDSRTLNSWAEALAHAQTLYTVTSGATRVVVTDQNGVKRIFPTAAPYPGFQDYGYQRQRTRGTLVPFSVTRSVVLGGPYAHLSGTGQLGQLPVETVNGVQQLTTGARNGVVGTLAALYAAQGLDPAVDAITAASDVFAGFTFYTGEAYMARFPGGTLPAQGLSPVSSTGYVVIINKSDIENGMPVRVVLAPDVAQAATIAQPGSEWALLESAPIPAAPPVEKKTLSPGVIAAGIAAAAVAALLIFA
jgi:hypothetical protein